MLPTLPSSPGRRVAFCVVALGAGLLSGCTDEYPSDISYGLRTDPLVFETPKETPPAQIDPPGTMMASIASLAQKGGKVRNPSELPADKKQELSTALSKLFGTPAKPKVALDDEEQIKALKLEEPYLAEGSKLYRRHCLHCHGLTGNGQGPTGPWVNPHPRDYRLGVFKFTSSSQADKVRKPRREDLLRTLRNGIEGTSMPSFALLSDDELNKLVSYVIHLSLRGEVEYTFMKEEIESKEPAAPEERLTLFVDRWLAAEKSLIRPEAVKDSYTEEEMKASVGRGQALFLAGKGECVKCHFDYGRQLNYKWDEWGTIVRPANLTVDVYRGGRRPIDLYWRIHSGIAGAGMQAFKETFTPAEIWDVVNFLQVLPYPKMREKYGINIDSKSVAHKE